MKWIVFLAAKLAVILGIGYGLYSVTLLNQRSVTDWQAAAPVVGAVRPASPGRSALPAPEQRRATADPQCTVQTRPQITADCIAGRAEVGKAGDSPVTGSTTVGHSNPAQAELVDPISTSSLAAKTTTKTSGSGKLLKPAREARRSVRPPNRRYAAHPTRKMRVAARQRSRLAYRESYPPRTVYAPWWSPVPYWQAY